MTALFEEIRPLLMDYEELTRRCMECADGHTQTQGFLLTVSEESLAVYTLPKTEAHTAQEAFVTLLTQAICAGRVLHADWWDKHRNDEETVALFHSYLLERLGPETEASFVPQTMDEPTCTRLNAKGMFGMVFGTKNIMETPCRYGDLYPLLQDNQLGDRRDISKSFLREQLALAEAELDSTVFMPVWNEITCFAELPEAYQLIEWSCSD